MATTITLSDAELEAAFTDEGPGQRIYQATFIPLGGPNEVALWDRRYFKADNKGEAVRIAREYGKRIIGKKLQYVYLVPKGGRRVW